MVSDFAIKLVIGGGGSATICSEATDNTADQLAKYESLILSVLGKQFVRFCQKIKESRVNSTRKYQKNYIG